MNKKLLVLVFLGLFASSNAVNAKEWIYYVSKGDTLWDLCVKHLDNHNIDECWRQIQKHNGIDEPREIQPNTYIKIPLNWLKDIPVAAVAQFATGDVHNTPYGATEAIAVKTGDSIPLGSTLTVADGAAVLKFNDGSELLLRHNSELILESLTTHGNQFARSTLRLDRGAVDIKAQRYKNHNQFKLITPGAVAAVRGTEFRVSTLGDGTASSVEVLKGGVGVATTGAELVVGAGYGVTANQGQPLSQPVALPQAPIFDDVKPVYSEGDVTVSWQPVADATAYQLELYRGAGGAEVIRQLQVTGAQSTLQQLTVGDYRLIARAVGVNGLRGLDSETTLKVLPKISAPVLDDASVIYKKKALALSWSTIADAQSYHVELSKSPLFETVVERQQVSVTELSFSPEISGEFYIRVKAVSADGRESDYSEVITRTKPKMDWAAAVVSTIALLLVLL